MDSEQPGVFVGLGKSLLTLFSRAQKSRAEQLEEQAEAQARQILNESAETIIYTRDDNVGFCDFVEDHNRIHRAPEAARAYSFIKFKDTPLVGVILASTGARISRNAVSRLKSLWEEEEDNGLKVIGQEAAFRNPGYPEEEISWEFTGYTEKVDEVGLTLTASVKKRRIMELTTRLGIKYGPMPTVAGPIISRANIVDEEGFQSATRFTKGEYTQDMLPMLIASFAPSGLLRILDNVEGDKEAANLRMNIEYLREPQPGRFQTDMFFPARIHAVSRPLYKFRTIASQGTRPINYVEIKCATAQQLDLPRLQDIIMPVSDKGPFNSAPSNQPDTDTSSSQLPQPSSPSKS